MRKTRKVLASCDDEVLISTSEGCVGCHYGGAFGRASRPGKPLVGPRVCPCRGLPPQERLAWRPAYEDTEGVVFTSENGSRPTPNFVSKAFRRTHAGLEVAAAKLSSSYRNPMVKHEPELHRAVGRCQVPVPA
jgi:hypothetical protein